MCKSILHYVNNYVHFSYIAPVTIEAAHLLELEKRHDYIPGTYRTDFIIDKNNKINPIEITCRYAFNGFLLSGYLKGLSDNHLLHHPQIIAVDNYTPFIEYLSSYFGDAKDYCILKGNSKRDEWKHYVPLLKQEGFEVHEIEYDEIGNNIDLLNYAAVFLEMSQNEILGLSIDVQEAIAKSNHLDDLWTIFLIHDIRFFSVLNNDEFLKEALTSDGFDIFRDFLIPTFGNAPNQKKISGLLSTVLLVKGLMFTQVLQ